MRKTQGNGGSGDFYVPSLGRLQMRYSKGRKERELIHYGQQCLVPCSEQNDIRRVRLVAFSSHSENELKIQVLFL